MSHNTPITVAYGDGIGPEIMAATLEILREAGARIETEVIEIGEKVYKRGVATGIEPSAWVARATAIDVRSAGNAGQGPSWTLHL